MNTEVANYLQRVTEVASRVHVLTTTCKLSVQIIVTVKEMKHYIAKFDVLTILVSASVLSIADRMQGMREVSQSTISILEQYEGLLSKVLKLVKKCSKSWHITLIMTRGIREVKLRRLELKIQRIQQLIFGSKGALDEDIRPPGPIIGLRDNDRAESTPEFPLSLSKKDTILSENAPFVSEMHMVASKPNVSHQVTIDLPGKIVPFENAHLALRVPNEGALSLSQKIKDNITAIPNLTGQIEIVRGPLLAGGFCDVYTGELIKEQGAETVAMKMLRVFNTSDHIVKAKKNFRREVGLWCSLSHRHVLPFYGTCELDEFRLFMVSPWAEGGSSLEYLRRNPLTDRGKLLWQTASALEYLHSGQDAPQVVHGDLKADNVLVSASGDALLCDFGLSRFVEEIVSQSGSSSAGRAGGHARFMAPELILPPKDKLRVSKATPESDVFAFGSLMLQLYTERLPFGELFEGQALLCISNGEMPTRPIDSIVFQRGLDDYIWELMKDCWKFQPADRPGIKEAMERLEARPPLDPGTISSRFEGTPEITKQLLSTSPKVVSRIEEIQSDLTINTYSSVGVADTSHAFWSPPLLQLRPPTPPPDIDGLTAQSASVGAPQPARTRTPPRVWAEIACHIPRFHLRSWLFVSSFHREIARRHLFRTINIYFEGDDHDHTRGLDILACVRQDKNFAKCVKNLRLHWNYKEGDELDILKRLLHEILPEFQNLKEFEWFGFPAMQADTVKELLASHPNIQSLSIVGWHFDAEGVSGFRQLRKFTIRVQGDDGFADIDEVREILDQSQHTLWRLTLGASLIGHHSWLPALQSSTVQKLTHIDLVGAQISASILMRISFAQSLKSLTLHGKFEHPSAVNVMFGGDQITEGKHRLFPRLEAFRFIMVSRENEPDIVIFESVLSFLRLRSQLRRLDLGNCPWELVRRVIPELSGLRVLRLRMPKLDDNTAKELVNPLPWGMLAMHVSVASSYQPADMALNVYARHFARFPLLSILHLESEYPRSLLERFNFRGDDALYTSIAQVRSIVDALPSLDFVGWHGVHYVVSATGPVKLQRSPSQQRLDGGKSMDLDNEDACWLERKDVPISYEISG